MWVWFVLFWWLWCGFSYTYWLSVHLLLPAICPFSYWLICLFLNCRNSLNILDKVLCKYFFLGFHFFEGNFLQEHMLKSVFLIVLLVLFESYLRNFHLCYGVKYSFIFFCRSWLILAFMLRYMIHFKLILVNDRSKDWGPSWFFFFIQVSS